MITAQSDQTERVEAEGAKEDNEQVKHEEENGKKEGEEDSQKPESDEEITKEGMYEKN